MAVLNAAFPIMPGKLEVAKAFGRDAIGPRRAELDAFQDRRGVTRETWAIQETPEGPAFSVVWLESADPAKAMAIAAEDDSPFADWFRERVEEINGLGLSAGPLPEPPTVTLDWTSEAPPTPVHRAQ